MRTAIELVERGIVPDWATRIGIRRLLARRLREQGRAASSRLMDEPCEGPSVLHADCELPPAFFKLVLGRYLKYSACYWAPEVPDLETAAAAMLALSCERARLDFDQDILDLGCGWGSLTLWMAQYYPDSRITALSNSRLQRDYVEAECERRDLPNVRVITADANDFHADRRFDRVVSVETFEHVRNHQALMSRIAAWLKPGGKLFVHVFSHRRFVYSFETEGEHDWMGRCFFTGGLMPSHDLLAQFQDDLKLEERWRFDGRHYQRTCEAWLANLDRHRSEVLEIFQEVYGHEEAARRLQRWRVFFMACGELFGYRRGGEWGVSHYRFGKP